MAVTGIIASENECCRGKVTRQMVEEAVGLNRTYEFKRQSQVRWQEFVADLSRSPPELPLLYPRLNNRECGYCQIYIFGTDTCFNHCSLCPLYDPFLCEAGRGTAYRAVFIYYEHPGRSRQNSPEEWRVKALEGARAILAAIQVDCSQYLASPQNAAEPDWQ